MMYFREAINKWGVAWGFIYGLVALGFYFTPAMLALLGIASLGTVLTLIEVLPKNFWLHFTILSLLLMAETILLYLRTKGVTRLTMADLTPHRAYIGTLVFAFIVSYLFLWLFIIAT